MTTVTEVPRLSHVGQSGTTMECLRHAVASKRDAFIDLCKRKYTINETSLARRLKGSDGVPVGLNLLKFQAILGELGYDVLDVKSLNPSLRRIRAQLAEGAVTFEDLQNLWGMNRDSVSSLVFAHRELTEERVRQFDQHVRSKLRAAMPRVVNETLPQRSRPLVTLTEEDSAANSSSLKSEVITVAATLLQSLQPLLHMLVSDDATKEDRTALRAQLGEGVIQDFRIVFGKLASEKSRSLIIEKQKEEGL